MSEEPACETCGSTDLRMIVHYGSYVLRCQSCQSGPATSFLSVARYLMDRYRATEVDEDCREVAFVAEGNGPTFMNTVAAAARSGKRILLTPLS